ncbi:MAG: RNA polymerase sigma-70 factor [Tannerellaceae bacterium]|nr:RNA polymerase sigma-70 factor [Tannerellaceae bacterium]
MKIIDLKGNFDRVYLLYFSRMFHFAKEYVIQDEDAENIVQDVFLMLWEKKDQIRIDTNLAGYLFTLTKYKSLDFLRHKVIQEEFVSEYVLKLQALEQMNYSFSTDAELQLIIDRAIGKLPDKCKDIFIKSRIEGKKYREIAEELQISVKTVENQMVIALKKLREELKEYLPLLLFLIS